MTSSNPSTMAVPSNAFLTSGSMLNLQAASVVVTIAGYVALCRMLRYRRREKEHSKRPYRSREDLKKMTAEDAWEIVKYIQGCEFPWISKKALSFALFRYARDSSQPTSHLTLKQNLWYTYHFKIAM